MKGKKKGGFIKELKLDSLTNMIFWHEHLPKGNAENQNIKQ